ncbi:MAG: hypothetical protein O9286_07480 [Aquidulcibacter sp.]|jgi:hypothetical protein|uniref:hypothetical protein n=2 Tax=Aquidulcibacter sp. TaxID=2052990 RepID=UPI0022BBF376|nr:hypothetical protein [Aquidulcibacter sp.]
MTKLLTSALAPLVASLAPTVSAAQSQQAIATRWEDYIPSASRIASPTQRDMATLNQNLSKKGRCAAATMRNLPPSDTTGQERRMIAAYEGQCTTGVGAVVLTLWTQPRKGVWEVHNQWATSGAESNLVVMPKDFDPELDQVSRFETAFQLDPFQASKLPPWTTGKVTPDLPLGINWRGGMERDLYETVRRGNYQIFCAYRYTMTCFADIPGRNTSQTPILVTQNYAALYEARMPTAALDVLLGKTPSLTVSELAIKEKAFDDLVDKAARDVVEAAINQATLPGATPVPEKTAAKAKSSPVKKR